MEAALRLSAALAFCLVCVINTADGQLNCPSGFSEAMIPYEDSKFASKWKDGNAEAESEEECAALCLAKSPLQCMGITYTSRCVFFSRNGDGKTDELGNPTELPLTPASGKTVMRRECAPAGDTTEMTTEEPTEEMTTMEPTDATDSTSTSAANNNVASWQSTISDLASLGDDWNIVSMSEDDDGEITVQMSYSS